jgi:hypothetical protein
VLAATLAPATKAQEDLDPVTEHYVEVLQTELGAVAKATQDEHIPCFHSPKGLRAKNCWKLHATLQREVEETMAALARVAVPQKLVAFDRKLKAGLRSYLARIKLFRAHPERIKGHAIDVGTVNDTTSALARQLRTYMPLLG